VTKAILAVNPHVCVAIEGLHDKPDTKFPGPDGTCWGAGFSTMVPEDVANIPPEKIVWSPHQYGSLAAKIKSTPAHFAVNWGFLSEKKETWRNQCVMVGEWGVSLLSREKGGGKIEPGTDAATTEAAFIDAMTKYMGDNEMDSYYFALNNSSADTMPLIDEMSKGSKTYALVKQVVKAMSDATPKPTPLTFPMPAAG
jgi:hypothetical protein